MVPDVGVKDDWTVIVTYWVGLLQLCNDNPTKLAALQAAQSV